MFFPFRFFDESAQVILMNRWEGTRCTWRRTAVGRFVERRTLLVKAVALRFQGGEEEMIWTIAMKKRALERQCSNARCIGEGSWRYFFLPLYRSFIPSMTALVKLSEGSAKSTLSPCFETIME